MTKGNLLKELRDTALQQSDADVRASLREAADKLSLALRDLTHDATEDHLQNVNCAWAAANRILLSQPVEPTAPTGGRMRMAA